MNTLRLCIAALASLVLTACVAPPQLPIGFKPESVGSSAGRIGVAMSPLPTVDTFLPGAGCLLCIAVASAANSSLTEHAHTLPYEDLPQLKQQAAELIRKKGGNPVIIDEPIKLDDLNDNATDRPNTAKKDFSAFRKKYDIDRLLVFKIDTLGFVRTYSSYVPTSEPKGAFEAVGFIVDLKSNEYEWYLPVKLLRSASGNWDEPPKFPGLTNAYFQALELGKDELLKPLSN